MKSVDAMKLMFEMCKGNQGFRNKYVSDIFKGTMSDAFKDHKIFKDFKWTPYSVKELSDKLIKMCEKKQKSDKKQGLDALYEEFHEENQIKLET